MKTLISNYQATLILIVIIVSTAIVFLPSIVGVVETSIIDLCLVFSSN